MNRKTMIGPEIVSLLQLHEAKGFYIKRSAIMGTLKPDDSKRGWTKHEGEVYRYCPRSWVWNMPLVSVLHLIGFGYLFESIPATVPKSARSDPEEVGK